MKKFFGIKFGGIQKRLIALVLLVLLLMTLVFFLISYFYNQTLVGVVSQTQRDQQEAISQTSKDTMFGILEQTLTNDTGLQARLADNEFSEIISDIHLMKTMAEGLLEHRAEIVPLHVGLPDPALSGTSCAYALYEQGVDPAASEYLGVLAHMSAPMIEMQRSFERIDGCYIGLCDGTDLCVDDKPDNKYTQSGELIPFPVRQRPWYVGAVEAGDLYFSEITPDAFSGKLLLTCSIPIRSDGEIVGVAGLDITLSGLSDLTSAWGNGIYVYVVSDRGSIIFGHEGEDPFDSVVSGPNADLREAANGDVAAFVAKALESPTEFSTLNIDGKDCYMVGAPMPTIGWTLISAIEKELTEQPEMQLLEKYDNINSEAQAEFTEKASKSNALGIALLGLVFLIGLAASTFATRRIVKPIQEMTNSIREYGANDEQFEIKPCFRTGDEIEVLAESFAELSRKSKLYFEENLRITQEKERVNTELHMATQIQAGMLPSVFPAFPNRAEFDIYASMDPAREVGGDFYDFFLVDDDHLCLLIADVSGKGIPAALFMMASMIILANAAKSGKSPAQILTETNNTICSNNKEEMFVTVWLGILELSTGKLTCANAGHEYPAIMDQGGAFELYKDRHGLVIGAIAGSKYTEYELMLKPGSKIFAYTDGVPEATNSDHELFGTDRMTEALNRDASAAPEAVLRNVRAAVDEFTVDFEQFDDLTMLCLEYRGSGRS